MTVVCRWLGTGAALFAGAGLPLLASGRVATAIAVALAVILVLLHPDRAAVICRLWRATRSPLGLSLGLLFALWLASSLFSPEIGRSLGVWGRMIGFIVGAGLIGGFLTGNEDACRVAFKCLIATGLFFLAVALAGIYVHSPVYGLFRGQGWAEVPSARLLKSYGSAVACLLPVWLWAGWRLGGTWRWVGLACLPLGVLLVFAVDSRAGLVGLAAALVVGAGVIGLGRFRAAFVSLVAALVLAATCLALAQLPIMPSPATMDEAPVIERFADAPPASLLDPHRQAIWGFARDRSMESPWLGHGVHIASRLPGAGTVIPQFNQEFIPSHPHNWLLEVFLETGALGTVALLVALVLLMARILAISPHDRGAGAAGAALFAAFWCSSFFNFSIWSSWWQVTFLLLLAFLLAGPARRSTTSEG